MLCNHSFFSPVDTKTILTEIESGNPLQYFGSVPEHFRRIHLNKPSVEQARSHPHRGTRVIETLCCALQDEVYVMGCSAVGASEVTLDGRQCCRHLKFLPQIRNYHKKGRNWTFFMLNMYLNTLLFFFIFLREQVCFLPQKVKTKPHNGLTVTTIATASHLTCKNVFNRYAYSY